MLVLIAAAATAATYITRQSLESPKEAAGSETPWKTAAAQPQKQIPRCDDKNIVGTVGGGAVGGIIGNQFGKGSGKTAATIAGAVGGAYLGNEYIPTRNATCR